MSAREEIEKLKKEFVSLNTEEQKRAFDDKFRGHIASKSDEEKEVFAEAFAESAKEAIAKARDICDSIDMRLKLGETLNMVSMAYIAENYFHKSQSWLSQRINGHKVNGRSATFNNDELQILSAALKDIGSQINETARSLV